MAKGQKTTQKVRTEIVAFCIEHGKNHVLTGEIIMFHISRSTLG